MLTTKLAFLIRLDSGSDLAAGEIHGRAEHLDSGRRIDFDDSRTLLGFLRQAAGPRTESNGSEIEKFQDKLP